MASLGTSQLRAGQLGAVTEKTINFRPTTSTTLNQTITGTFTVGLSAQATSTTNFDINAMFAIDTTSSSTSVFDAVIVRVFLLDFDSNSISSFEWTLSEDSYEELYGETLGSGERQIVILGSAEID